MARINKNVEITLIMAKKFVRERERCNLSQEDLAYIIGLSRVSICNIESGEQGVTINILLKAAKAFNCSPLKLLPNDSEYTVDIQSITNLLKTRTDRKIANLEKKLEGLKQLRSAEIKLI